LRADARFWSFLSLSSLFLKSTPWHFEALSKHATMNTVPLAP
jgi:hypothetical protein